MFLKLKTLLGEYKSSLFTVNNEKLSMFSKLILIVFVIFMFSIIGTGIEYQTKQLKSINSTYGYKCINLYDTSYIDLKQISNDVEYDYYKNFGTAKECQDIEKLYKTLITNIDIKAKNHAYIEAKRQVQSLKNQIRTLEKQYGNMLLEDIAKQKQNKSILQSNSNNVKHDIRLKNMKILQLEQKINRLNDLGQNTAYITLTRYIKDNSQKVLKDYESFRKFHPFKKLLLAFSFLIPLLIITWLVYKFFLRKRYFILGHLSIHIFNVAALYSLYFILELIYSIIPKVFLGKLIEFLMSHNMIIIFNYLVILFFVALFGFIIYRVQKHQKYKKELLKDIYKLNAIKKFECIKCGCKLKEKYLFCPTCGIDTQEECKSCRKQKIKEAPYCHNCGQQ